jgi:predicted PurR-regulated permease PerM
VGVLVEQEFSRTARGVLTLAALVIVVAGMREASSLLLPFLVSAFLALICAAPLFWLKGKGVPSVVAVLLVVLVLLSLMSLIGVLVGTSLNDFYRALPSYQESFGKKSADFQDWIRSQGIKLPAGLLSETFSPGSIMRFAATLLSSLGGLITNAFVILLTIVFMLLEASSFPVKLRAVLTDPGSSLGHFSTIAANINRYIALKTLVSLATGFVAWIWLTILGVDFAILWGLLTFILNYIPNIGSIIAAIPPTLLALVQFGPGTALLVLVGYVVINAVLGSLLEPRLMGYGLDLSTLVVFISLVAWQWVLGPVGMLLSVPLTMTLKIALESHEDTRWIGILLGSGRSVLTRQSDEDENLSGTDEVLNAVKPAKKNREKDS